MFDSGLVVGKFAPLHKGHELLLAEAMRACRQVTVLVYANPDFPQMPQAVRAGWIRALFPTLQVLTPQGSPPDAADDATHRAFAKSWLEAARIRVDAVFSSEDYGAGFAELLGAEHVMVDRARRRAPVSGTAVRADVYGHRHMLSPLVYRHFITTVVFLGAESTGKSTLTARMAETFGTTMVREVGRDYYAERNGVLTLPDYVEIAKLHQRLEDAVLMEAREALFIDTNALTTLFYSYYYNGGALRELHEIADACPPRYDINVVCDTDIAFEQDGWRDTAELREKSQRMVLMDLNSRRLPYTTASGSLEARGRAVREAVAAHRSGAGLPESGRNPTRGAY